MNHFENVLPLNKEMAEIEFQSDDINRICRAMVAVAYYEKDWKWAQEKCLAFFVNENYEISCLAATCLGHIVRVNHILDKERVEKLLRSRINDPKIAGFIEDALSDISIFYSPSSKF